MGYLVQKSHWRVLRWNLGYFQWFRLMNKMWTEYIREKKKKPWTERQAVSLFLVCTKKLIKDWLLHCLGGKPTSWPIDWSIRSKNVSSEVRATAVQGMTKDRNKSTNKWEGKGGTCCTKLVCSLTFTLWKCRCGSDMMTELKFEVFEGALIVPTWSWKHWSQFNSWYYRYCKSIRTAPEAI